MVFKRIKIKSVAQIFLFIGAVFLYGCENTMFHPKIAEGKIEYTVSYPVMDPDNVMADFMPKEMILQFKNNKFITELSAGMGMFRTNFVGDCETYQMTHLVKMVNKKYAASYDTTSVAILNKVYDYFTIVESNETKTIAGYECKKVWVIFTDVTMPNFELYYTTDISLKSPNWSLPFASIDGVLMEYDIKRNGIIMRFKATKVTKVEVDNSLFEIPEEYVDVSIDEMEEELDKLFETFNY